MRQLFIYIGFVLFLGACGDTANEVFQGDATLKVRRGEYNQIAIRVENSGQKDPDYVLIRQQGYEQAKERFFQMDVSRRIARAKLAELYGPKAYKNESSFLSDTTIWSLGLVDASERGLRRITKEHPKALELLQAFADGVNQYINKIETDNPRLLEMYRRITHNQSYRPDAWKPIDSIAVGTQMSFLLSSSLSKKAMMGSMYLAVFNNLALGTSKLEKLVDMRPLETTSIIPRSVDPEMRPDVRSEPPKPHKNLWERLKKFGGFAFVCPSSGNASLGGSCGGLDIPGSNNWVVSKDFAGGNQSFLANDPHLNISFPATFVEVALDSTKAGGTLHLRGVVPAGAPGILIGHNKEIAWGLTNSMTDVDDIYAESFHPEKPDQVRRPKGEWVKLERKSHKFFVRQLDGTLKEETQVLRFSPGHGPIVTDHVPQFKQIGSVLPGTGFSYKWTGHRGTTELVALLNLARAKDFAEFKEALSLFEAGAQNFVYSDRKGNIGYYLHGLFPKRPYLEEAGAAPPFVPDMSYGENEWDGFREKIPELYKSNGYIVTANNDPLGHNVKPKFSGYKDYLGFRYAPGSRAKRIVDLMEELKRDDGKLTVEDMRRIQFDHVDLMGCRMIELLEAIEPKLKLDEPEKALVALLLDWKSKGCVAKKENKEVVQYTVWLKNLAKGYYEWLKEDVDGTFASLSEDDRTSMFASFVASSFAVETVYHKTRESMETEENEVIKLHEAALENATAEIARRQLGNVRWGKVHYLKFLNIFPEVLPSVPHPRLERDGSLGTVDIGGFDATPEVAGHLEEQTRYPNVWGANFRMILVLEEGKPIDGYNVIPGGNTSSLESPNAIKELLMWRDGKQRKLVRFIE